METICDYLAFGHKHCDNLFTQAQASICRHDWHEASVAFRDFYHALKQHIWMEEKVLFPAFEQAMSNSGGPIAMLRTEHAQIRGIVDRMFGSLNRMDSVNFLIHSETFTILMQQHSMKEEDMLYPLLDKLLSGKQGHIIDAMSKYVPPDIGAA